MSKALPSRPLVALLFVRYDTQRTTFNQTIIARESERCKNNGSCEKGIPLSRHADADLVVEDFPLTSSVMYHATLTSSHVSSGGYFHSNKIQTGLDLFVTLPVFQNFNSYPTFSRSIKFLFSMACILVPPIHLGMFLFV